MSDQPFTMGSCACNAVKLTVNGEPKMMIQCHCKDCQKVSSTGHLSNAMFAADDVVVDGELKTHKRTADSGNIKTYYFCGSCGGQMFSENTGRPGIRTIQIGCLDDTSWYAPQAVVFTKCREDWDITTDQVPNFEEMPPPQG